MLLPLFHLSVFSLYSFGLWYDQEYLDLPFPAKGYETLIFKARPMFLTLWCLLLQTIYFLISFLNDIVGTNEPNPKKRPIIRIVKDTMFGLAFALAIYVGSSFWSIYHYDKELIFPERVSSIFPSWLNHMMHTLIVLFIFIELLFTNKTYPSRTVGIAISLTFYISYLIWMHYLFETTGAWPYPIMEVLNLPARIVFFTVSIAGGLCLYILGEKLNSYVSPTPRRQIDGKQKKR